MSPAGVAALAPAGTMSSRRSAISTPVLAIFLPEPVMGCDVHPLGGYMAEWYPLRGASPQLRKFGSGLAAQAFSGRRIFALIGA